MMLMEKTCSCCGESKSVAEFGKNAACKDGLQRKCRVCMLRYEREYKRRPEVKKRRAEEQKEYRSRPEVKKHRAEAAREYWSRPEVKKQNKKRVRSISGIPRTMIKRAKERAKDKGRECTIKPENIIINDTCPYLGIPLQLNEGQPGPGSPSLDRINSGLGYVKGNVEVISNRANTLKSNGTSFELMAIGVRMLRMELGDTYFREMHEGFTKRA
jgi:hypothetical protein